MNPTLTRPNPFAAAATEAAALLEPFAALAEDRRRLEGLAAYVPACGDVLADLLESLVSRLAEDDAEAALRLDTLLLDVLLAEEGFSRRFWKALRHHLRRLHVAGRDRESERRLRESLTLAAALG